VSGQIDALTATPKVCQRVDIDPLEQGYVTSLVGIPTSNPWVPYCRFGTIQNWIQFFASRSLFIPEIFYCKKLV